MLVVNPDNSEFKLEKDRHYSIKEKNYRIERWTMRVWYMKTSLAELKVLTLDCQATGANPDKGHLLEIGWIPTRATSADNPMLTGLQAYLVRLPPDATIPRAVERITGISADFSAAGISPKTAWERLIATAQQVTASSPSIACPTIIHFARFEHTIFTPTSPKI